MIYETDCPFLVLKGSREEGGSQTRHCLIHEPMPFLLLFLGQQQLIRSARAPQGGAGLQPQVLVKDSEKWLPQRKSRHLGGRVSAVRRTRGLRTDSPLVPGSLRGKQKSLRAGQGTDLREAAQQLVLRNQTGHTSKAERNGGRQQRRNQLGWRCRQHRPRWNVADDELLHQQLTPALKWAPAGKQQPKGWGASLRDSGGRGAILPQRCIRGLLLGCTRGYLRDYGPDLVPGPRQTKDF